MQNDLVAFIDERPRATADEMSTAVAPAGTQDNGFVVEHLVPTSRQA